MIYIITILVKICLISTLIYMLDQTINSYFPVGGCKSLLVSSTTILMVTHSSLYCPRLSSKSLPASNVSSFPPAKVMSYEFSQVMFLFCYFFSKHSNIMSPVIFKNKIKNLVDAI